MPLSQKTKHICCVLIRGTRLLPFKSAKWTKRGSELTDSIRQRFPDVNFAEFSWTAAPTQASRHKWSCVLANQLNELRLKYDRIFVIGHSHGGNVGLQAIQMLTADDVCLIAMATPFIHVRRSSLMKDTRWAAATVLAALLLASLGLGWIWSNDVREYFPLYAFLLAAVYAAAVLSSGYWIDYAVSRVSRLRARRQALYSNVELTRPIDVLVLHYGIHDEVGILLRMVRRTTLMARRIMRRHFTKTDAAATTWLSRNPNKVPAVLVGLAGALAAFSWFVPNFGIALLALVFVALGLVAFIANYSAVSLRSLRTLVWVGLSGLAGVLHGALNLGHPMDMLGSRVKTSDKPKIDPLYAGNLTIVRLGGNASSCTQLVSRTLLFKLSHSRMVRDFEALEILTNWMGTRLADRKP
jgi:hypothetical protein